jgi:hypothetical protein
MQIRKKWLNKLKTVFNKHFSEYYLATCCCSESLQVVKITVPYCSHIPPVQGQHADVNGVLDKGDIVHELVGGKGGDGVQEEGRAALEVAYRHRVQALVHLDSKHCSGPYY